MIARHGGIVRLNLGVDSIYLVGQPEHVEYVLKDRSESFGKGGRLWEPIRLVFGNGLATSEGEFWLRQRRLMQPLFGRQRLADLSRLMVTAIGEELEDWRKQADGRPFNLSAHITHLAICIFLRALFNTGSIPAEIEAVERAINTLMAQINVRVWSALLPKWIVLPGARQWDEAMQVLDRFVFSTIESRRRERDRTGEQASDLLTLLINAREGSDEGMTDQQLRDEITTLILAGYENSSTTIAWCMYELLQHPEMERKLRQELDTVLGKRDPGYEDLARLHYAKMFVCETQRFHSTLWLMLRESTAEEELGGFRVPKGSKIVIPIDGVHHNPRVWKDPHLFRPERFSPEESAGRPRAAFLPFGIGPHQCIGNNFSLIEVTLAMVMMVQRFRIRQVNPAAIPARPLLIQKPREDLLVYLEPA